MRVNNSNRKKTVFRRKGQLVTKPGRSFRFSATVNFFLIILLLILLKRNTPDNNGTTLRASLKLFEQERCDILNTANESEISVLSEINLNGCGLKSIPPGIKNAISLRKLDISGNHQLTTLPFELSFCTRLDVLFVSDCPGITNLPRVLGDMPSITRLGWRSGSLRTIEAESLPPNLKHLILTNNNIENMNDERVFQKFSSVRKLMLSHNKISSIHPTGASHLSSVELIRLAGNDLSSIPKALWELPNLTWLTISGNPNLNLPDLAQSVPSIALKTLSPNGEDLGEGASGKVASYTLQEANRTNKEVAVKLIHGVTSDGRAEDELKIYGAVGAEGMSHRVVGCLALLNDEKKGVVMERLPNGLHDLALPPTIREITVDRWESKFASLSIEFVKNALLDVAMALSYLHGRGISHGDVYAHNMKVDPKTGHVFLLDFGASYATGSFTEQSERIEARAFGILVGELLERLDRENSKDFKKRLEHLKAKCMDKVVRNRWSLLQILEYLEE